MAAPIVYKSTDANAPSLTGQAGSLISVLKACLVDGYTGKSAAGWTIALEDAPNHKIIFRNNAVTGSGRYFRVQDNGKTYIGQSTTEYDTASLVGMHGYTDIDTPTQPYPRVLSGGNLQNSTAYGVTIRKTYSTANPTYVKPWVIVADNRMCYLITAAASANSTTMPIAGSTTRRGVTAFGDIKSFNTSNTTLAKSIVIGGELGAVSTIQSGINVGTVDYYSVGYLTRYSRTGDKKCMLDISMENGANAVLGRIKGWHWHQLGGSCLSTPDASTYIPYPSHTTFDIALNPLVVCEDAGDTIRTTEVASRGDGYEFAFMPGFYGLMNTTSPGATGRIGDDWTVFTDANNKTYLLGSLYFAPWDDADIFQQCVAFSLEDWWS